jgi:hypothetical protein
MDSGKIVTLMTALLPGYLIVVLVYAVIIIITERGLAFRQSLLIAAASVAVSIALLMAYYIGLAPYLENRAVDNLAGIVVYCIMGVVITRLARDYGIRKVGWFGVGARANLWLLAVSWPVTAVVFGAKYWMGI